MIRCRPSLVNYQIVLLSWLERKLMIIFQLLVGCTIIVLMNFITSSGNIWDVIIYLNISSQKKVLAIKELVTALVGLYIYIARWLHHGFCIQIDDGFRNYACLAKNIINLVLAISISLYSGGKILQAQKYMLCQML